MKELSSPLPTALPDEYPTLLMTCYLKTALKVGSRLRQEIANFLERSVCQCGFGEAILLLMVKKRTVMRWWVQVDPRNQNIHIQVGEPGRDELYQYVLQGSAAKVVLPLISHLAGLDGKTDVCILNCEDQRKAEKMLDKGIPIAGHISTILKDSIMERGQDNKRQNWEKLSLWVETAHMISSALNVRQMLHVVIQLVADTFAARCCIFMVNPEKNTIVPMIGAGSYDLESRQKFRSLAGRDLFPAFWQAYKDRRPVIVTPESVLELYPADVAGFYNLKAAVVAPILLSNKVSGFLQVDRQTGNFREEDAEVIFAIAKEIAVAAENARLRDELNHTEATLQVLLSKVATMPKNTFSGGEALQLLQAALNDIEAVQAEEEIGSGDRKDLKGIDSKIRAALQILGTARAVEDVPGGNAVPEGLLTPREMKVLALVARGLTNKEVSLELSISNDTVKSHLHSVYQKLGVSSRSQAIMRAIQMGIAGSA
ncbi:MAG: GAF domain-containing protein [Clostridia bacterium]|nr:MAG: GAF domain-containing protein [Clostridia bacterium]